MDYIPILLALINIMIGVGILSILAKLDDIKESIDENNRLFKRGER